MRIAEILELIGYLLCVVAASVPLIPVVALFCSRGRTLGEQIDSAVRSGRLSKDTVHGISWLTNVPESQWRWKEMDECD